MKIIKKNLIGKIIIVAGVLFIIYGITKSIVSDNLLMHNGFCTNGKIVKRTQPGGKVRPSLVYKFIHNNKIYFGLVAEDDIKKIGDTICVVYLESYPNINRPLSYFDNGEIKCNCIK